MHFSNQLANKKIIIIALELSQDKVLAEIVSLPLFTVRQGDKRTGFNMSLPAIAD